MVPFLLNYFITVVIFLNINKLLEVEIKLHILSESNRIALLYAHRRELVDNAVLLQEALEEGEALLVDPPLSNRYTLLMRHLLSETFL